MKVVRHDKMMRLIGDDQIPAMPLIAAGEQKMSIGNLDGNRIFPM